MDFDYLIDSLTPELVEKKKKYANFKVTPIGGREEIAKWREVQAAKESVYRMRLAARDARIADIEATLGAPLAKPTIHTTSWEEKLAFADTERKRLSKLEEVAVRSWDVEPEIKKSVLQRFTGFVVSLWKSANF